MGALIEICSLDSHRVHCKGLDSRLSRRADVGIVYNVEIMKLMQLYYYVSRDVDFPIIVVLDYVFEYISVFIST